jgi:hypothetical protein
MPEPRHTVENDAPAYMFLTPQDRRQLAGWFEADEPIRSVQEVADSIVAREVAKASAPPHMLSYPTCWCGDDHWDPGQ